MKMDLITGAGALTGEIQVPGDKSISHRAVMLSALSEGETRIRGFLRGEDCLSTIRCFQQMGIEITEEGAASTAGSQPGEPELLVRGKGLRGLRQPAGVLDCGNSGTTMRLLSGILAAQDFSSVLTGDGSLRKRPMGRILRPLSEMGAEIRPAALSETPVQAGAGLENAGNNDGNKDARNKEAFRERARDKDSQQKDFRQRDSQNKKDTQNICAPLSINGRPLKGIAYRSPVASAQVKSAILFAGLYADGETSVCEPSLSRDHSERMLRALGADVQSQIGAEGDARIRIKPCERLTAFPDVLEIPGDISSAAYFLAAAMLLPGSRLSIRNVGVNATRTGMLDACKAMGANIQLENPRLSGAEEVADISVRCVPLHGTEIAGSLIPRLIDELPVLAALAAGAEGVTVIKDAAELKVKESNRIRAMAEGLGRLGVKAEETEDGMVIYGQGQGLRLRDAQLDSYGDHRIAMSFAVLALAGKSGSRISLAGAEYIRISYPRFFEDLRQLL